MHDNQEFFKLLSMIEVKLKSLDVKEIGIQDIYFSSSPYNPESSKEDYKYQCMGNDLSYYEYMQGQKAISEYKNQLTSEQIVEKDLGLAVKEFENSLKYPVKPKHKDNFIILMLVNVLSFVATMYCIKYAYADYKSMATPLGIFSGMMFFGSLIQICFPEWAENFHNEMED